MSWTSNEDSKDYKDVANQAFASPTSLVARYGNRSPTINASTNLTSSNTASSRRNPSVILSKEDAQVFEHMATSTNVIIGGRSSTPHLNSASMHSMADKVIKNAISKADTVLASSGTHSMGNSGVVEQRSVATGRGTSVSTMTDSATIDGQTGASLTATPTATTTNKGTSTLSATYTYTHTSVESSAIVAPSQIMVPKTSGPSSTSNRTPVTANNSALQQQSTPTSSQSVSTGRKSAVSVSLNSTSIKSNLGARSIPSSPSKRGKDLDLKNNDNSFSVIGGLIVDFFQSKVKAGETQVNLTKEDLKKLERLAPPRVRANFIEAVKHRVQTLPPNPTEAVHKLTRKCQKFGFDKDGSLNPLTSAKSSITLSNTMTTTTESTATSNSLSQGQKATIDPSTPLYSRAIPSGQQSSVHSGTQSGKSFQQSSPGSQGMPPPKLNVTSDPPESSKSLINLIGGGSGAFSGYQNPQARDPSECGGSSKNYDNESVMSDMDTSTIKTGDVGYHSSALSVGSSAAKQVAAAKSDTAAKPFGTSFESEPALVIPTASVKSEPIFKKALKMERPPKPSDDKVPPATMEADPTTGSITETEKSIEGQTDASSTDNSIVMLRKAIGGVRPKNGVDAPDPPLFTGFKPDPSTASSSASKSIMEDHSLTTASAKPAEDPSTATATTKPSLPDSKPNLEGSVSEPPQQVKSVLEAPAIQHRITPDPSGAEQQTVATAVSQQTVTTNDQSQAQTSTQSQAQHFMQTQRAMQSHAQSETKGTGAQQSVSDQSVSTHGKIDNYVSMDADTNTIGEVSKATDSLLNELTVNDSSTQDDFGSTESLARQQLMAELREATNLMAESKTTEAAHFWREHVVELQARLRALHGGANDTGSISTMETGGTKNHHPAGASIASDILSTIVSDQQLVKSAASENLLSTLASDLAGMSRDQGNVATAAIDHPLSDDALQTSQRMIPERMIPEYQAPLLESHRLPPNAANTATTGTTTATSVTSDSAQHQPQEQLSAEQTELNIDPSLEGVPMVDVVAPADLPGGYHFEAEIEGRRFLATVPAGGVRKGETFSCYMRDLEKVGSDIPVGRWRDGVFNCCSHGPSPVLCNSLFCPLIMLSQIFTRVNFDFLGRRHSSRGARASTMRLVLWFWLLINAGLFSCYYLKWWNHYDITNADFGAFLFVNIAYIIFTVYVTASARGNLREKYFIRETFCYDLEDCCCATFCLPCTVCQMARHTADYDDYEAVCCNNTGLPDSYQPEAVAPTPRTGNNKYYV